MNCSVGPERAFVGIRRSADTSISFSRFSKPRSQSWQRAQEGCNRTRALCWTQCFNRPAQEVAPVPLGDWLERATFFTELRDKEVLLEELWVPKEESRLEFRPRFKRRELRRELLASMFRLGNSSIDLYITIVNRLGRLERDAGGEDLDNRALAHDVLAMLERQRTTKAFRAYHELRDASANFDLIVDVNVPSLWELPLESVSVEIGKLLRAQQPIGGMSGQVNQTVVRQFRMPGYPFILITTDLLQEGEDLHLFCSDVYHYGIAWMPSSMEQRIGRMIASDPDGTEVNRTRGCKQIHRIFYRCFTHTCVRLSKFSK